MMTFKSEKKRGKSRIIEIHHERDPYLQEALEEALLFEADDQDDLFAEVEKNNAKIEMEEVGFRLSEYGPEQVIKLLDGDEDHPFFREFSEIDWVSEVRNCVLADPQYVAELLLPTEAVPVSKNVSRQSLNDIFSGNQGSDLSPFQQEFLCEVTQEYLTLIWSLGP